MARLSQSDSSCNNMDCTLAAQPMYITQLITCSYSTVHSTFKNLISGVLLGSVHVAVLFNPHYSLQKTPKQTPLSPYNYGSS